MALVQALAFAGQPAAAEPLKTPVSGPKLICFKYSTFSLLPDERITDFSGSFEGMSIKVEGLQGEYTIGESEIFKPPSKGTPASRVLWHDGTSVFWVGGTQSEYAILGRTRFSPDAARLILWLSGVGLQGKAKDAAIYSRIVIHDTEKANCQQTFSYSF